MDQVKLAYLICEYLRFGSETGLADDEIETYFLENCILDIAKDVINNLSIDSFRLDRSLSGYIDVYKQRSFVEERLGKKLLVSLLSSASSRHDFMYPQCFNLIALKKGFFTISDSVGDDIAFTDRSFLLLYSGTSWIAIPFLDKKTNKFYFLICNEYWGFPCTIIDFASLTYYTDCSSPLFRNNHQQVIKSISTVIINIIANILAGFFNFKRKSAAPVLVVGGVTNISHILWNYIGGLAVLERCDLLLSNINIVAISELLFDVDELTSLDFSFLYTKGIKALTQLRSLNCLSALHVRFSDAGINPNVCSKLLADSTKFMCTEVETAILNPTTLPTISKTIKNTSPSLHHTSLAASLDKIITITLRCGKRKLIDQANTYFNALRLVRENLGSDIQVLIDGHSKSTLPIPKEILEESNRLESDLIESGINSINLIGLDIYSQINLIANSNSFVTYLSGGNAKFIGFCSIIGVLIGPHCPMVLNGKRDLPTVCKARPGNVEQAYLETFSSDDSFGVYHDTAAYQYLVNPSLVLHDEMTKASNDADKEIQDSFNKEFLIDPSVIAHGILKTLKFNSLLHSP